MHTINTQLYLFVNISIHVESISISISHSFHQKIQHIQKKYCKNVAQYGQWSFANWKIFVEVKMLRQQASIAGWKRKQKKKRKICQTKPPTWQLSCWYVNVLLSVSTPTINVMLVQALTVVAFLKWIFFSS